MASHILSAQRLRELLSYDPETGAFVWIAQISNRIQVGGQAGSQDAEGYVRIGIDGKLCQSHRLAWLWMTGAWPIDQIDHRNGVRDDNRFANLREASNALNGQNRRGPQSNNVSGFLGVSWSTAHGKWLATIKTNGNQRYLGLFECPKAAHAVYLEAKRAQHPGCTI